MKAVIFDMYETLVTLFCSPNYFCEEMHRDAGVSLADFKRYWYELDTDQATGKCTMEDVLAYTLKQNGVYTEERFREMVAKRKLAKSLCFDHLHPEIIPMLKTLHKWDIRIGLISNCYSEEAELIKKSVLYPFFDAPMLSFDEGLLKPDAEIFFRCAKALEVDVTDCLYVGDGGSRELETAEKIGMRPIQACWYLKENTTQPCKRMEAFPGAFSPMEIVDLALER